MGYSMSGRSKFMDDYMDAYNGWQNNTNLEITGKFKKDATLKTNLANGLDKVYNKNQRINGLEADEKNAVMTVFGLTEESIRNDERAKQNLYTFINIINERLPSDKRMIIAPDTKTNVNNFLDAMNDDDVDILS